MTFETLSSLLEAIDGRTQTHDFVKKSRKVVMTLVYVCDNDRCLLGLKKRGFGAGLFNGFGGKVAPGESVVDCAKRELHEESGISAPASSFMFQGRLDYSFDSGKTLEVHFFSLQWQPQWLHDVVETDEMRPEWFSMTSPPLERMWEDDKFWVRQWWSSRKFFRLHSHFDSNNEMVVFESGKPACWVEFD